MTPTSVVDAHTETGGGASISDRSRGGRDPLSASGWPVRLAFALLAVGLVARLAPLFDFQDHLFWNRMTEDGYLMQTVARNMAIGLGMTTAEGSMPTNGVQPMATFLYAALHWLAGGSKALGIAYGTIVFVLIACASAWALRRVAFQVFVPAFEAGDLALLVSALWFASPLIIFHSMNGLETGLYYLTILVSLHYYLSLDLDAKAPMPMRQRIVLGLLLGVAFQARNDAVFFIAALLIAHAGAGQGSAGGGFRYRAADALVAGAVSLLVAAPWLIHNRLRFGSIVPQSGAAESMGVSLGANLAMIPANLLQAEVLYLPIRKSVESTWAVALACSAVLIGLTLIAWRTIGRRHLRGRRFFFTALLFASALSLYYGIFFGAPWFVSRYLSAASPLLAVLGVGGLYFWLLPRLGKRRRQSTFVGAMMATSLLIVLARLVPQYLALQTDGHRQVVEWVQGHLTDQQWVGAVQTGTLGYFHDRTINLDGKVNPRALRQQIERGDIRPYIVDETPIDYIADWSSMADWVARGDNPRYAAAFEVIVRDEANNLSVTRRRVPILAISQTAP